MFVPFQVLGIEHEETTEITVPNSVIRSCLLIVGMSLLLFWFFSRLYFILYLFKALYLMWLFEVIIVKVIGGHSHSHGIGHVSFFHIFVFLV